MSMTKDLPGPQERPFSLGGSIFPGKSCFTTLWTGLLLTYGAHWFSNHLCFYSYLQAAPNPIGTAFATKVPEFSPGVALGREPARLLD